MNYTNDETSEPDFFTIWDPNERTEAQKNNKNSKVTRSFLEEL